MSAYFLIFIQKDKMALEYFSMILFLYIDSFSFTSSSGLNITSLGRRIYFSFTFPFLYFFFIFVGSDQILN